MYLSSLWTPLTPTKTQWRSSGLFQTPNFFKDNFSSKSIFDRKYSGFKVQIRTFNQSRYPRINRESLMPVARSVLNAFLWMVDSFFLYGHFLARQVLQDRGWHKRVVPSRSRRLLPGLSLWDEYHFFSCSGQFNRWHCQSVTCDLSDKDKHIESDLVI